MKYISPLRYPGGKTQLYTFISYIIEENNYTTFYELCAGGANLSLLLLKNKIVNKVIINDYDKGIYSLFFNTLNYPKKLIELIKTVPFDFNDEYSPSFLAYYHKIKKHYNDNLNQYTNTDINLAFETLFLNRTNYSGIIIKSNPIGGLQQNGKYKLNCRFNKKALIKKINLIHTFKNNIILKNQDINQFLASNKFNQNTLIFIDPPYVKQGNSLYTCGFNSKQHQQLADNIKKIKSPYIITYDDDKLIQNIYSHQNMYYYSLKYSSNNKNKGNHFELMITSSNLHLNNSIYLQHI